MRLFQSFCIFLCFSVLLCSCNSDKETKVITKDKVNSDNLYQLDLSRTQIIWNGYMTTDREKVVGMFTDFTCDRNNREYTSLNDLITGLNFTIKTSSSISGNQIRDLNLKYYFFKQFTDNFELKGSIISVVGDSIDVKFKIFSESKIIRLGYRQIDIKSSLSENHYDCLLEIKGSIDLKEQFNAIEAYNNISDKCHDLHKGSDGISKTWTHVDVHVKAFIDKKPFK